MTENNQNSDKISAVGVIKKTVDGNYRYRRIASMLLDHFIMCILIVPSAIIMTIISEKLGQRKLGIVKRIKKQIDKFGLTDSELGFSIS